MNWGDAIFPLLNFTCINVTQYAILCNRTNSFTKKNTHSHVHVLLPKQKKSQKYIYFQPIYFRKLFIYHELTSKHFIASYSFFLINKNLHRHLINPVTKSCRHLCKDLLGPHEVQWRWGGGGVCLASCMNQRSFIKSKELPKTSNKG